MYKIVEKIRYSDSVKGLRIHAPQVARRAEPGQFVMLRAYEDGERIPLTIAAFDRNKGSVLVILQEVGKTTRLLGSLEAGDALPDIVGPLGNPSDLEGLEHVCIIGGGLGCAIAYPQAAALHERGARVEIITGFRTKELIILENEMRAVCHDYAGLTDDGSNGNKGLVTDELRRRLEAGARYDAVIAIGPLIMMKYVVVTARPYGVRVTVSMNPVMVDGTGMCGGCRITVDGKPRFACVDGPEFDGYTVDFDDAMRRASAYRDFEQRRDHECRLALAARQAEGGGGADA